MMFALALAAMLGATGAMPADRQRLPAQAIASAVEDAVRVRLREAGSTASAVVSGRIADQTLPPGKVEVRVGEIRGALPRPRIGVPVRLLVDGHSVRPMTIWVELSDVREVLIYADDYAARADAAAIALTHARVDMTCCQGQVMTAASTIAGQRTRRAVHAGRPAMVADFEPMPAVSANETVAIAVRRGLVRLRVSGVALQDGNAGDRVLVRLDQGEAFASRVVGKHEVEIDE